jgi:iron complex outermembrane receptor protein
MGRRTGAEAFHPTARIPARKEKPKGIIELRWATWGFIELPIQVVPFIPVFPATVCSNTVCGVIMKKKLITLAIFAAINPAWGEDLGTIVVSAARTEQSEINTPASITIIGREEIQNSHAQNIADVLRARGGVNITDLYGDGSRATVDMRGFGETAGQNTLILVDGRKLNTIDLSNPVLSSIALRDVERIEIVQGSAGTLFGDQAVGGVINIITRKPERFNARLEAGVGSYNRRQVFGSIANSHDNGLDYRVSAKALSSDNYRDNNDISQRNLFASGGYNYRTGRVFADIQDFYEELEAPGALTQQEYDQDPTQSFINFADDYIETRNRVGRLGLRQAIGKHWQFEGEYTHRDESSESVLSSRFAVNTDAFTIDRVRKELTPRFIGYYDNAFGEMQFSVGYDYSDVDYESQFGTSDPSTIRQKTDGWYGQAVLPFYHGWSATVGGRRASLDNEYLYSGTSGEEKDTVNVMTLGLQYRPSDTWRLFLRRDENFRFATTDELTFTVPGDSLETQEGVSHELGAEWQKPGYRAKAVVYRLDLDNELGYDPNASGPFFPFFPGANVNFDKTERKGVILEADHNLTEHFRLGAVYNYTNAKFKAGPYSGKWVTGVPRESFKIMSDYDFAKDWHWFFEANYTGQQFLSGDFENTQGWQSSFTVLNTAIDYRWKGLMVSARVNNIADKKYAERRALDSTFGTVYYPAPGRNYWLTASYDF